MKAQTIRLTGPVQRAFAKQQIDAAPDGYVAKIAAETRRDAQNRKMHAMFKDLQDQVPKFTLFNAEDLKARFLNALGTELRFLPTLDEQGLFPVGLRSSTLTVEQFSALIELIYAEGAKHGVRWTDPTQAREAA